MSYARATEVAVYKSQQEIEQLVRKYGATEFFRGEREGRAMLGFELKGKHILFELPLPMAEAFTFQKVNGRTAKRTPKQIEDAVEQATRSRWRALMLAVKAKLVSVETGVESFEEAFLAQIVVAGVGGKAQRFGAIAIESINQSYKDGQMPRLQLGAGGPSDG